MGDGIKTNEKLQYNWEFDWRGALFLIIIGFFILAYNYSYLAFEEPFLRALFGKLILPSFTLVLVCSWFHELYHLLAGKLRGFDIVGFGVIIWIFPTGVFFPFEEMEKHAHHTLIFGPIGTLVGGMLVISLFFFLDVWPFSFWWASVLGLAFLTIYTGRDDFGKLLIPASEAVSKEKRKESLKKAKIDRWTCIYIPSRTKWNNWLAEANFEAKIEKIMRKKAIGPYRFY